MIDKNEYNRNIYFQTFGFHTMYTFDMENKIENHDGDN